MADRRHKDGNWSLPTTADGRIESWDYVQIAVLMDIRDELRIVRQRLQVLECRNFLEIPRKLDRIGRNTAKKRKPKVAAKSKLTVVR